MEWEIELGIDRNRIPHTHPKVLRPRQSLLNILYMKKIFYFKFKTFTYIAQSYFISFFVNFYIT
jgi:hypothetical protein